MNPAPTVSVVIPTKDRPEYLRTAIESILGQTRTVDEIIVVDDGSETEDTHKVTQELQARWQQCTICYIHHMTPQGANSARNAGIRAAKGEWIAFLDDDDQWDSTKIEKQLHKAQADESCGAVYCGMAPMAKKGAAINSATRSYYPEGWLFPGMLVEDVSGGTPSYMIRRSILKDANLFDVQLPARQDWDMWIRVSQLCRIAAVPEILVYFGNPDGDRITKNPHKALIAYRTIYNKYKHLHCELCWSQRLKMQGIYCHRKAAVHRQLHQPLKAIMCYTAASIMWPPLIKRMMARKSKYRN